MTSNRTSLVFQVTVSTPQGVSAETTQAVLNKLINVGLDEARDSLDGDIQIGNPQLAVDINFHSPMLAQEPDLTNRKASFKFNIQADVPNTGVSTGEVCKTLDNLMNVGLAEAAKALENAEFDGCEDVGCYENVEYDVEDPIQCALLASEFDFTTPKYLEVELTSFDCAPGM